MPNPKHARPRPSTLDALLVRTRTRLAEAGDDPFEYGEDEILILDLYVELQALKSTLDKAAEEELDVYIDTRYKPAPIPTTFTDRPKPFTREEVESILKAHETKREAPIKHVTGGDQTTGQSGGFLFNKDITLHVSTGHLPDTTKEGGFWRRLEPKTAAEPESYEEFNPDYEVEAFKDRLAWADEHPQPEKKNKKNKKGKRA